MVDVEKFKKKVKNKLEQSNISFFGKNFNKIVSKISESQFERILDWLDDVHYKNIRGLIPKVNLRYKNWKLKDLFIFRHPFSMNNVVYRILVVKVRNSNYIEFHLGDHKYYDKATGELLLKKSSK